MKKLLFHHLLLLALVVSNGLLRQLAAAPLMTNSRWIVEGSSGKRVKLACVNWSSHLEPMLVEGMGKQPLDTVAKMIASMGFNCVRLTWPLYLVTNDTYAAMTVRQSFQSLGLLETVAAIQVNNPALLDLTLIDSFKAVVSDLGDNNIMVILDNHVTTPGWCCDKYDGNGFFGDKYFDPNMWINGLTKMAAMFKGSSNVIGMSLRNELRGPNENVNSWYSNMQRGAEEVHSTNPDVLVILSGLDFDLNLSFLSERQVELSFTRKLVFELHWYSFSDGQAWVNGNLNQVCGRIRGDVLKRAGFLLDQGWPLFLSEYGFDQGGGNTNDNSYLSCLLSVAAELDLDWALWALQGSYYIRQGTLGYDESYGLLAWDWHKTRNSAVLQRLQALQPPFQGPGISDLSAPYLILFHPLTGQCVLRNILLQSLLLGPCDESEAWTYTQQQTLTLKDSLMCVKADDIGKPAKLGVLCGDSSSKWQLVSDSKMHLSASVPSSSIGLCLDVSGDGKTVVMNPCKCLSDDKDCDPESQWFKMVQSTRSVNKKSISKLFSRAGILKLLRKHIIDFLM